MWLMHVWHHDITYGIMALINNVTSKNKMTHFGCSASEVHFQKLPENGRRTSGMVHPDCWVVRVMPHIYITLLLLIILP